MVWSQFTELSKLENNLLRICLSGPFKNSSEFALQPLAYEHKHQVFSLFASINAIPDWVFGPMSAVTIVTHWHFRTHQFVNPTMILSKDLRERVIRLYLLGRVSMPEVANQLNVSLGFIHNIVSCYRTLRQVTDPWPWFYGRCHALDYGLP